MRDRMMAVARVRRILFISVAVVSLLLCATTSFLWVHSAGGFDSIGARKADRAYSLDSMNGELTLVHVWVRHSSFPDRWQVEHFPEQWLIRYAGHPCPLPWPIHRVARGVGFGGESEWGLSL